MSLISHVFDEPPAVDIETNEKLPLINFNTKSPFTNKIGEFRLGCQSKIILTFSDFSFDIVVQGIIIFPLENF